MYLYKTTIFHDVTDVYGLTQPDNDNDVTDFEGATKKPNAIAVDDVILSETTFIIIKDYSSFDAYIDGTNYNWSDVKYIDDGKSYTLLLSTSNPL